MDNNTKWTLMLMRQFPPLIASIYGIYNSKVYNNAMVICKENTTHWFVDKRFLKMHDEDYVEEIEKLNIQNELDHALQLYEIALKNIEDLCERYKNEKNLSKIELLELLYSDGFLEDFGNYSFIELKENIAKLKTLFDNYGIITAYPQMALGTFTQETLINKLAQVEFGKPFSKLPAREKLKIERHFGTLTAWHPKLSENPYIKYEKHLLKTVIELRNKLSLSDVINSVRKEACNVIINSECLVEGGLDSELEMKIRNKLIDIIQKNPIVMKFLEEHGWIGAGWKFGGSIDEICKGQIVDRILQYIMKEKLPEIDFTKMEEKEKIYSQRKKKLIGKILQEGTKDCKQLLLNADIIVMNQVVRFYRKCYLLMIHEKCGDLIKDVAIKCGIHPWEDIHYLTMPEILEGLKNKSIINREDIENRKKAFIFMVENGIIRKKFKKSGENDVRSYIARLTNSGRLKRTPYPKHRIKWPIMGTAYNIPEGKWIEGNIVLLHNVHDLYKAEKGDIIVAPMIEPYHTIYMRKISGLIVEDSSRLSHAVVIAQTRNIPLIVDASYITYAILKDNVQKIAINWNGEIEKIEWGKEKWPTYV